MSNEPITISDVIYDFILRYTDKLYTDDTVFLGYQNNYVLPKDGNFVIFQLISHTDVASPTQRQLNATTVLYQSIREATLQVDFYGVNAIQASSQFASMLRSNNASDFLLQYGIGLTRPQPAQDLSGTLDDKRYVKRFMVQFNVRYCTKMTLYSSTFSSAKVNSINLVEGDKICRYQSIE